MSGANHGAYRINRAEVQKLRSARPISDKLLASKVNVHIKTLRKWLNRGEAAYFDNIRALAQALGLGDDYHSLIDADSPECRSATDLPAELPSAHPRNGSVASLPAGTVSLPPGLCELRAVASNEWATMRNFVLNLQIKGLISSREHLVLLESIQDLVANELKKAGIAVTSMKGSLRVLSYTACGTHRVLLYLGGAGNDDTIDPWWQLLAIKPERLAEFLDVLRASKCSSQDLLNIERDFMHGGDVSLQRYANQGAFGESLSFRVGTYAIKPYDSDIQRAADVFQFDPLVFWKVIYDLPESADNYRLVTMEPIVR